LPGQLWLDTALPTGSPPKVAAAQSAGQLRHQYGCHASQDFREAAVATELP